jgi:hypothetical protein
MTDLAFAKYIHLIAPAAAKPEKREPYTRAEKLALVAEWKNAGMSASEFAEMHGIQRATFGNWTRGMYLDQHGQSRRKYTQRDRKRVWAMLKEGKSARGIMRETGYGRGFVNYMREIMT